MVYGDLFKGSMAISKTTIIFEKASVIEAFL